jgi:hypothetical protein
MKRIKGGFLMDDFSKWQYEVLGNKVVENLNKRNYNALYAATKEEAKQKILDIIEKGSSIGLGGSHTLNQLGVIESLRKQEYNLLDRYDPNLSAHEVNELLRQSLLSDYYLTSTNALTLDGQMVNIDGRGNRVAAMIFGPKRVIVVVGANKITNTLEEAMDRTRNIASPRNSKRLDRKTPCTFTGKCEDCGSSERICRQIIVTHSQMIPGRVTVIVVGETLGF